MAERDLALGRALVVDGPFVAPMTISGTWARSAAARRIRLDAMARLRRLGPLPWALLVLWMLVAQAQEPKALRSFGIAIGPQGAWVAASLILPFLFTQERIGAPMRVGAARGTSLLCLAALGVVQALLAVIIELLVTGRSSWSGGLQSAGYFLVAWLPAACCSWRSDIPGGFADSLRKAIIALCVALGVGMAHRLWHDGVSLPLMATAVLASVAAVAFQGPINEHK